MSKKEKRAEMVRAFENRFRCPYCQRPMKVVDAKSLVCVSHHTFDFTKEGYVNLLTRPVKSNYDKTLFEARNTIITSTDLYEPLHEKLSQVIDELIAPSGKRIILDAGSGEGSHLQKVLVKCKQEERMGIGLDISKDGIRMAAKKDENSIWFVGDLAHSPIANAACDGILNILSPANYEEFKRVLKPNGLMVKVVPREMYLQELRDAFYSNSEISEYRRDEPASLFKKHFHLHDSFQLTYEKELNEAGLRNLVHMSPLAWNAKVEQKDAFIQQGAAHITVDLDVLVGIHSN